MKYFFDNNIRRQIQTVINYAKSNVYQVDDILDMMNGQMTIPGDITDHVVVGPLGIGICYYLVEHPQKGLCHYFQFKPDTLGKLPNSLEIEYVLKAFEINPPLLPEHITIDEVNEEIKVVLPDVL